MLSMQRRGGLRLGVAGSGEARLSSGTGLASVDFSVGHPLRRFPPSELPLVPNLVPVTLSGAWAQWPSHRMGAL